MPEDTGRAQAGLPVFCSPLSELAMGQRMGGQKIRAGQARRHSSLPLCRPDTGLTLPAARGSPDAPVERPIEPVVPTRL